MNELNKRSGRVGKKPLLKAGKSSIKKAAATVVFVPSTKGSTLLMSMREDEDKMADMTGFRVKYQEAGGSVLTNMFNKDLARGQHWEHPAHHVTSLRRGKIAGARTSFMSPNVRSATPLPAVRKMMTTLQEEITPPQGRGSILGRHPARCMNVLLSMSGMLRTFPLSPIL